MNIKGIFRAKAKNELILINALSLLLIFVVIFFPSSILRPIIGIPFVLFFPGYVFLLVLFPNKNEFNTIERFTLSLALSIVIVSFLGLLLCFSSIGLKLYPATILPYLIILALSVIDRILRRKIPNVQWKEKEEINFMPAKLNFALAFVTIIIILTLIRFLPASKFPYAPIHYDGETVFNYRYLLNTGHYPDNLPTYGSYTQNLNRAGDPVLLLAILNAYLQIITNLPGAEQFSLVHVVVNPRHIILSACLSTILALTALSISQRCANRELRSSEKILVVTFSLSSSPAIILGLTGWNAGYGFVFFILILSLFLRKELDYKINTLLLLFSLYIILIYHTIALFFALLMIIAILYTFLFKKVVVNRIYALTYLIIFGAYLVYEYTSFLGTTVFQLWKFIHVMAGKMQPYLSLEDVSFPQDISFLTIYGISVFAGAIPLIFAFILALPLPFSFRWQLKGKEKDIFRIVFIGFMLACIGFYSYMGIIGIIQRMRGYTAYLSVLAFSVLISSSDMKHTFKKLLSTVGVIAILTSLYVYFNTGAHNYHLTIPEKEGAKWLLTHSTNEDVVFTDLRLSAIFVSNGHFKVIGPFDPPQTLGEVFLKWRLHAIFYGDNSTEAIQTLAKITTTTGESFKYLFFSSRMTKGYPEPSIYAGGCSVRPAPPNFLEKYDRSNQINKIYNSDIITIYVRVRS